MNKSLRFHAILICFLIILPIILMIWTTCVSLDQLWTCLDNITEHSTSCQDHLITALYLIKLAIAIIAALGLILLWIIFRCILAPLLSIQNTIRQARQKDSLSWLHMRAGNELHALDVEINGMISIQQQEEAHWVNLHRTLTAISATRRKMFHETDKNRLIQCCCSIFVDSGKYRKAQIHLEGKTVHTMPNILVYTAERQENRSIVSQTMDEMPINPIDRAMRNRQIAIISNIFTDSLYASLQDDAIRVGYSSILAIPISADHQVLGAITLYGEKPDEFGVEIVHLLTELAEDLGQYIHCTRFPA